MSQTIIFAIAGVGAIAFILACFALVCFTLSRNLKGPIPPQVGEFQVGQEVVASKAIYTLSTHTSQVLNSCLAKPGTRLRIISIDADCLFPYGVTSPDSERPVMYVAEDEIEPLFRKGRQL